MEERVQQLAPLCESPIELMLLGAIDFSMALARFTEKLIKYQIQKQGDAITLDPPFIVVIPQYRWQDYRIDFAIFREGMDQPAVFVECDGHEFHERTADQAERDRTRDRRIQAANISILRFTGREINRDPFHCVAQVLKFIWREQ
jgi:hypothetical protein